MGETPSANDTTATTVNKIIHDLVFDVAVGAAENAAIAQVPLLGLPIIKQIFDVLVGFVAGKIADQLEHVATFTVIDIQTDQESSNYQKATDQLTQAVQSGNPALISVAKENARNALASLIHFDGSSPAV